MSSTKNFDWATFAGWLEEADRREKVSALARVAYELTVRARDTYEPGTIRVSNPSRLRAINELMHRLTRRVLNLLRGSEDSWKEAEFWQALCDLADDGGCLADLVAATSAAGGRASNLPQPVNRLP